MPTVYNQDKFQSKERGTPEKDATIIYSSFTDGVVYYQIKRHDNSDGDGIIVRSNDDLSTAQQIISISSEKIAIALPFRTRLQVRTK